MQFGKSALAEKARSLFLGWATSNWKT